MTIANIDLGEALVAAHALHGDAFSPQLTLKALTFFDEGNLATIPSDVRQRLATAVRDVDLKALPRLDPVAPRVG